MKIVAFQVHQCVTFRTLLKTTAKREVLHHLFFRAVDFAFNEFLLQMMYTIYE